MATLRRTSDDLDRLFELLGHPARRRLVTLLAEADGDDEVALEAVVADGGDPVLAPIELYHAHLPKLDEAGYVRWDRSAETVRPGPRFEDVAPLIRLLADHRDELPGAWP